MFGGFCGLAAVRGGLESGHYRSRRYISGDSLLQVDAVVFQGGRKYLVEAGAILGVGGLRAQQCVLRGCQGLLLQQDIGRSRSAQPQLLHFGVQGLLRIGVVGDGRLHQGAIVSERELRIHHIHADLRVELLQLQFRLAVLNQRRGLLGLRRAIADGNRDIEAKTLVRR